MTDCRSAPTIAHFSPITSICLSNKWSQYTFRACECQVKYCSSKTKIIRRQRDVTVTTNFSNGPSKKQKRNAQFSTVHINKRLRPRSKRYVQFFLGNCVWNRHFRLVAVATRNGRRNPWSLADCVRCFICPIDPKLCAPSPCSPSFCQFNFFPDIPWFFVDLAKPWRGESSPLIRGSTDAFNEFFLSHREVAVRSGNHVSACP